MTTTVGHQTLGDSLYSLGGTSGRVTPGGPTLTGPFSPATPFVPNDQIQGTQAQLVLRYCGASPAQGAVQEAKQGEGEETPMQALVDVIQHPSNPLGLDPSVIPAMVQRIQTKNNGCVEYYDLNCVVIGGNLAAEYIKTVHAALFPVTPVTPPAPVPDPAPTPPPATPVKPVTPPPPVTSLTFFNRFQVSMTYQLPTGASQAALASTLPSDPGSQCGCFVFAGSVAIQVGVKLIDGTALGGHYWVFLAGFTNVACAVTVIDIKTGLVKTYNNPANTVFWPVQDTGTFAAA